MPRLFVIDKDIKNNILKVGSKEDLIEVRNKKDKEVILEKINWISEEPIFDKKYLTQIRYRGEKILGKLSYYGNERVCRAEICFEEEIFNEKIKVVFDRNHKFVTPGQILAFYDGDTCLGAGVILEKNQT